MLYDNSSPRYFPHLQHPQVLNMGLSPLGEGQWIETDNDLGTYHQHKLQQRALHGAGVYRAADSAQSAAGELADMLLDHLLTAQPDLYQRQGNKLYCRAGDYSVSISSNEPLWNCSLWLADDLVILAPRDGEYHLTAASLCSPSHWRLQDKFGRPMREIHDPVPGFHAALTPRIDRFFKHLKPRHPVVRGNWALQENALLKPPLGDAGAVSADTPLFYRSERQTLVRLPQSGAIAFTIRVYLHPLESLAATPGAVPALLQAIDAMPPAIARYKGMDRLAPALAAWRNHYAGASSTG